MTWAGDLRCRFPVLDERVVDHPNEMSYLLWKLSWSYGRQAAHHTVSLERLIADPNRELSKLLDAVDS